MTKKSAITIIGVLITALGIGMFLFGVSMFSYHGPPLSDTVSKLGMYSFLCCMPVLIAGAVILVVGIAMKKKTVSTDI